MLFEESPLITHMFQRDRLIVNGIQVKVLVISENQDDVGSMSQACCIDGSIRCQ